MSNKFVSHPGVTWFIHSVVLGELIHGGKVVRMGDHTKRFVDKLGETYVVDDDVPIHFISIDDYSGGWSKTLDAGRLARHGLI